MRASSELLGSYPYDEPLFLRQKTSNTVLAQVLHYRLDVVAPIRELRPDDLLNNIIAGARC